MPFYNIYYILCIGNYYYVIGNITRKDLHLCMSVTECLIGHTSIVQQHYISIKYTAC
jgi:hypothetical protein